MNPQKLVDVKFSFRPADTTQAKFNKLHKLPPAPHTENLQPMNEDAVGKVTHALNQHLRSNYKVHIEFTQDEVRHFLCPKDGVVYAWFVETPG